MHWLRKHATLFFEATVLLFFSLTPLLWLHGNEVILGHDSGFRLNFTDHIKNLYFAWNPYVNFGAVWSLYHGFIPVQSVETFLSFLFTSLAVGEKLAFVFWFFAMGMSMYVFVRHFFSEDKYQFLRFIAPISYMFNFYVLNAWAIAERAKFSLYIALPLMIVIFFKTIEKEWSLLKGGIIFGLLFFFFNGGGSPPLYGGILVTFALLVVYFLFTNLGLYGKRLLGLIAVFGLCFVLLNSYWILPQARLVTSSYSGAVSSRGGIDGLISWEREVSKHASIPNILRLQGFPDWYDNPEHAYANTYIHNKALVFLSFLPILTVGLGFLFIRLKKADGKAKRVLVYLLLLGAVGLFFTAGSHPPFGFIYVYFMRHVPGFAVFRSSFYKFAPTVYVPIIIFSAYYLSEFLYRVKLRKFGQYVVLLIVPVAIALYHFPYFTGNFFSLKEGFSTRVTVPVYVTDMMGILQAKTTVQDRILLVPALDVGFINSPIDTYTWGFYSLDVLPRIGANRSFLANDSSDDSVTRNLYRAITQGDEPTLLRLSAAAGVTHVLWRGDARLTADTEKKMPLSSWKQKLAAIPSVRPVHTSGLWTLYEVQVDITPMVYAANSVSFVQTGSMDDAYIIGKALSAKRSALLRTTDNVYEKETSFASGLYRQAECFYCKNNEYSKLVEAILLPKVRAYPLAFLNDRKARKEEEAIAASKGSANEIDARLSAASFRLSEIITKKNAGQENIQTYQSHLQRITEILGRLAGRQKDFYANRVMAHLDAHLRDTKSSSDTQHVLDIIEVAQAAVRPYIWIAGEQAYRLGVTLPSDGDYTIWIPDSTVYTGRFEIDGKTYSFGSKIELSAGYHRLALTPINSGDGTDEIVSPVFLYRQHEATYTKMPAVSFVQKNPTRYEVSVTGAQMPFALVLNQRFDPGWGLAINGIRQDYAHYEANGFGNSWIIPKTGDYELSLYYIPQQFIYLGGLITIASLVVGVGYIVAVARRRRST